jgi:uncharacterized membrane protein
MDTATMRAATAGMKWTQPVIWALAAIAILVALSVQFWTGAGGGMALPTLFVFPLALIHGIRRYGAKGYLVFFVFAYVLSNVFENLSILTGFPFGHYHYTGSMKLFLVPVEIGLIYVGLGYICWIVANAVLREADAHLDWRTGTPARVNTFALPIIAGSIMTMWDVSTDHWASTVNRSWIWENGGGFFGVPYSNYLGWWFVTWSFFQAFSLYLAVGQSKVAPSTAVVVRGGTAPAVLIYGAIGLQFVLYQLFGPRVTGTVVDATGHVWNKADMYETMAIVATFTVIPIALLSLFQLWRGELEHG